MEKRIDTLVREVEKVIAMSNNKETGNPLLRFSLNRRVSYPNIVEHFKQKYSTALIEELGTGILDDLAKRAALSRRSIEEMCAPLDLSTRNIKSFAHSVLYDLPDNESVEDEVFSYLERLRVKYFKNREYLTETESFLCRQIGELFRPLDSIWLGTLDSPFYETVMTRLLNYYTAHVWLGQRLSNLFRLMKTGRKYILTRRDEDAILFILQHKYACLGPLYSTSLLRYYAIHRKRYPLDKKCVAFPIEQRGCLPLVTREALSILDSYFPSTSELPNYLSGIKERSGLLNYVLYVESLNGSYDSVLGCGIGSLFSMFSGACFVSMEESGRCTLDYDVKMLSFVYLREFVDSLEYAEAYSPFDCLYFKNHHQVIDRGDVDDDVDNI